MNKTVPVLAMALAGSVVASLLTAWRKQQRQAKTLEKEDIHRWEDEGGKIPGSSAGKPTR